MRPPPRARPRPSRRIAVGATAVLARGDHRQHRDSDVLAVNTTSMSGSLAGTGGLPGGREAGLWIKANVPQGAPF
jgi:hypothetical protein